MSDLGEFFSVHPDTHELVDMYRANPNMPARQLPGNAGDDIFRGNDLNPRQRAQWSSWFGAKIYWNGRDRSQIRIMVHPTTGQIAHFPLLSNGGHNYASPRIYRW